MPGSLPESFSPICQEEAEIWLALDGLNMLSVFILLIVVSVNCKVKAKSSTYQQPLQIGGLGGD